MKVAILGTRGIPAMYGGFETFAQELSLRLAKKGLDVTVFCDEREERILNYKNVNLQYINCSKSEKPLLYYYKSIREARKLNNFLIICGSPGSLFLYNRVFSNKVKYLINIDGIEHLRGKWSFPHKLLLLISEWCAAKYSDYVIADSSGMKKYLAKRYKIQSKRLIQIEYGANIIGHANLNILEEFNLKPYGYHLVVSRLEPENNIAMIVEGYKSSGSDLKLIIVGDLKNCAYVEKLKAMGTDNIHFIGGVYDKDKLKALRFFCKSYIHGHSVGGTNPSLLEALGCKNIVIAHDNIFNREVTGDKMFYFKNSRECANAIMKTLSIDTDTENSLRFFASNRVKEYYNWNRITDEYFKLISKAFKA